jgi:hypothetical protein
MPTFFSSVRPISVKTVIFPYCTVKSSFLYVLFSLLEEGFDIDGLIAAVSKYIFRKNVFAICLKNTTDLLI